MDLSWWNPSLLTSSTSQCGRFSLYLCVDKNWHHEVSPICLCFCLRLSVYLFLVLSRFLPLFLSPTGPLSLFLSACVSRPSLFSDLPFCKQTNKQNKQTNKNTSHLVSDIRYHIKWCLQLFIVQQNSMKHYQKLSVRLGTHTHTHTHTHTPYRLKLNLKPERIA